MANRLIAMDKSPGVCPIGIGKIFCRLFAKCILFCTGTDATSECGNFNLCVGLDAGIEGAAHAMAKFECAVNNNKNKDHHVQAATSTAKSNMPMGDNPNTDNREAMILVDARNRFNEINCVVLLWTVQFLWASGARFAFNCYIHYAILIFCCIGKERVALHSKEGVTQGDPLSMVLYGLALVPIAKQLQSFQPNVMQAFYADNLAMKGPASKLGNLMRHLCKLGLEQGYYPEPEKSIVICHPSNKEYVQQQLSAFQFKYRIGSQYIGTFVGPISQRTEWLTLHIDQWVFGV